jgi:hypothetical protein
LVLYARSVGYFQEPLISECPQLSFPPPAQAALPFLPEWPDFVFEGPGVTWLLIELSIGIRHRWRPSRSMCTPDLARAKRLPLPPSLKNDLLLIPKIRFASARHVARPAD